jgi:hypothetical protein
LPTVDKYLTELSDWLEKMQKSGRLQHDVNTVLHDGASVFHVIGDAIKAVDKVTGSFVHTLEICSPRSSSRLSSPDGRQPAGLSRGVGWSSTQANLAAGAEERAAAGANPVTAGWRLCRSIILPADRRRTNVGKSREPRPRLQGLGLGAGALIGVSLAGSSPDQIAPPQTVFVETERQWWARPLPGSYWNRLPGPRCHHAGTPKLGRGGSLAPSFLPTFPGTTSRFGRGARGGPFGNARPIAPFKSFALTLPEQITQARAALTKSTADDVAAAKAGDRPDQEAHGRGETQRQEPPASPPG